jgi:urease accessory protein
VKEAPLRTNCLSVVGPTIFAQVKKGKGVDHIVGLITSAWKGSGAGAVSETRGGPKPTEGLSELNGKP